MPDINAIELQREVPASLASSFYDEVRTFFTGALLTAAIAVIGTVVATLALTVGMVGSPIIAAAIAYAVVRRRRARAAPSFRPVTS